MKPNYTIENVKLISLHVPKTAGTSVFDVLKDSYGKKRVARVDYRFKFDAFFINDKKLTGYNFPKHIEVIHGHIKYHFMKQYLAPSSDTKIITWVRHPVQRVISDYYFALNVVEKNYKTDPLNPSSLKRVTKSLIEFARSKAEQNRMSTFLDGASLDDFFFVGITENLGQDLDYLSRRLNWNKFKLNKLNKTRNRPLEIEPGIMEEIERLNQQDMDLYNHAFSLNQALHESDN